MPLTLTLSQGRGNIILDTTELIQLLSPSLFKINAFRHVSCMVPIRATRFMLSDPITARSRSWGQALNIRVHQRLLFTHFQRVHQVLRIEAKLGAVALIKPVHGNQMDI